MIVEVRDPFLGGAPEWILIEMQGVLSATGQGGGECVRGFDGRLAGYLRRADAGCTGGDRLLLQVGNHTITGFYQTLDKALHVLQSAEPSHNKDVNAPHEFVVSCVVRRKLVFTDRSVPVISASLVDGGGGPGARKKV